MPYDQTIGIRFTPDDLALLDALAEKEERKRSDIIRRAIRAYAQAAGVSPKPKRPAKGRR